MIINENYSIYAEKDWKFIALLTATTFSGNDLNYKGLNCLHFSIFCVNV